jgi:FAD/FMN-containing dehydrogenase/Fe-S oxidoreductase
MEKTEFQRELEATFRGDVLFDDMSRLLYSTDASLYQIKPAGVVLPRDRIDVIQVVRLAAKHGISILPRGGGTSLAGQTVTSGIVVDFSKYMNQILEVDEKERWVRVQPGIILDNLNAELSSYDLFFAPDVATSSRANIGGMIGNNSSGVRSVRYGKTVDHVLGLSIILSSGEELELEALSQEELAGKCSLKSNEGRLYQTISRIVRENRDEIARRFPKVMRRVSGYNLDELVDSETVNLAKILVGSEGTLALVTEAKLNLEPVPPFKALAVIHFRDLIEAIQTVPAILRYDPSAVEILDRYGLELALDNPAVAKLCRQFIQGTPEAVLIVESSSDTESSLQRAFEKMLANPEVRQRSFHIYQAEDNQAQQRVWQVRKNALGVMLGVKGDEKPLPFIEDSCIPVEHLGQYISQLLEICKQHNRRLALYAHASVGVIHVRPLLNLKKQSDVDIMASISQQAFELVRKYGGSWSGEHGDGLVRSYKVQEFFGDQIYSAFREVKKAFDPDGLMNPGKIVEPLPMTENLRIHPGYKTEFPTTYYRFEDEGGLDRAIELCTGVGQCRKTLQGVMCPSFIATRDEEHSTRGRANALRSAIAGDLGLEAFTSERLFEVLDLCLECKACKSECPSNVDMAKMKAEFLAHYYEKNGVPLGKRIVSMTRRMAEFSSFAPAIANFFIRNGLIRWGLEKIAGIDRRRPLPSYAKSTLVKLRSTNNGARDLPPETKRVALFVDTFVNYYEPKIGIAAIEVLEALGFEVVLADVGCCGRPLISAGLLKKAKLNGKRVLRRLEKYARDGVPIVVLEPSCLSTLKDDFPDLMDDRETSQLVAKHVYSFEGFLNREEVKAKLSDVLGEGPRHLLFHSHCQQRALTGVEDSSNVLNQMANTKVKEIEPGCCGMAGVFGYEKEHYALSEKIGSRNLFPTIKKAENSAEVVAGGFSCRSQIAHFTGKEALHPAEILAKALRVKHF